MKERFEKRYNLIKEGHNQEIENLKAEVNQLHERLEVVEKEIEERNPENKDYKELISKKLEGLDLENATIDEKAKAAKKVARSLIAEKHNLENEKTQIILQLVDKEPALNAQIDDYENKLNNIEKIDSVVEMQEELDFHALMLEKELESIENEIKEHEEKYNDLDLEKKELQAERKSLNEEHKSNVKLVKDNKKTLAENMKKEDAIKEREKVNEDNVKKLKADVLVYLDKVINDNAEKRLTANEEERERLEAEFNENNELYKKVLNVEGEEFLNTISLYIIKGMGTDIDSLYRSIYGEKEKILSDRKQIAVNNATLNHEISKLEDRTYELYNNLDEINKRKEEIIAEKAKMRNDKRKLERKKNSTLRKYNDCRNKSARCDLVIGRLLDGEKWDDISVKLENFKNKDYTCEEKISERKVLPVTHIAIIEDEPEIDDENREKSEVNEENREEQELEAEQEQQENEEQDDYDLEEDEEFEDQGISESAFAVLDSNVNVIAEREVRKAKLESEHIEKGNVFDDLANSLSNELEQQAEKQENEKPKKKGFFAKLFEKIFKKKSKEIKQLEQATEEADVVQEAVQPFKEKESKKEQKENVLYLDDQIKPLNATVISKAEKIVPAKPKMPTKPINEATAVKQNHSTVKNSSVKDNAHVVPYMPELDNIPQNVSIKPVPIHNRLPNSSRDISPDATTRTIISKLDPEDRKVILGEDANNLNTNSTIDEDKKGIIRQNNEATEVFVDEMIRANDKKFNAMIELVQNDGIKEAKNKIVNDKKQREEEKERKQREKEEAERRRKQEEFVKKQKEEREAFEAKLKKEQEEFEEEERKKQEEAEKKRKVEEAEKQRKENLRELFRNKYKVEAVNNSRKVVEAHRDAKTWSKYASNDEERNNLYVNNSMKKNSANAVDERD